MEPLGRVHNMRNRLRLGIIAGALVVAPFAATVSASAAVPLQEPESVDQADPVGVVCTYQYPPSPACILASISASASGTD